MIKHSLGLIVGLDFDVVISGNILVLMLVDVNLDNYGFF